VAFYLSDEQVKSVTWGEFVTGWTLTKHLS